MKTYIDKLGKVAITVEENYWNINNDYDKLTVVEKEGIFGTYISRKPVPAGTELTNRNYWIPFSSLKEEIVINYNTFIDKYKSELEKIGLKLNNHEDRIKAIEAIESLINQLIDKTNQAISASKTMASEAANSVSSANKVLGKANEALRDAKSVREEAQTAANIATEASSVANQVAYDAEKVLRRAEDANKIANDASNKATEALDTSKRALCTAKYYLSLAQELKQVVDKIWDETIIHHEAIKKALDDTKKLHDDMRDEIANINKSIANINNTLTFINNSVSEIVKDIEKNNADIQELFDNKVDKIDGKGLSTNDFTNALKEKLDSLFNYDDTELQEKLETLITNFNTLVNDNPTQAIENFNEIIAFLENIEDSETLDGIIAGIETQIANTNKTIENLSKKVEESNGDNETKFNEIDNKFTEIDESISNLESDKVDKEDNKGLSTNDFTNELKDKLNSSSTTAELTKEEFEALEVKDSNTIYIVTYDDKKDIYIGEEQINKGGLEVVNLDEIPVYVNIYMGYDSSEGEFESLIYLDRNKTNILNRSYFIEDKLNVITLDIQQVKQSSYGSAYPANFGKVSIIVYYNKNTDIVTVIKSSDIIRAWPTNPNNAFCGNFIWKIQSLMMNSYNFQFMIYHQIKSDWEQTSKYHPSYIKNKPTKLSQFENDSNFVNTTQVDERFEQLVGAAPEALDTLEEIAAKLSDNDDIHSALVSTIAEKAKAVELTEREYKALETKDSNTFYIVTPNVAYFTSLLNEMGSPDFEYEGGYYKRMNVSTDNNNLFQVGDTLVVPDMEGYTGNTVTGNLNLYVIDVYNNYEKLVVIALNDNPEDVEENALPHIKIGMRVELVYND